MNNDNIITATISPDLKKEAQAVLDKLGISMSTAIRLFLSQIILYNDLPFEVKPPKSLDSMQPKEFAEVIKQSLEDAKANKGITISEAREILNKE